VGVSSVKSLNVDPLLAGLRPNDKPKSHLFPGKVGGAKNETKVTFIRVKVTTA